jgi:hypothetical protein
MSPLFIVVPEARKGHVTMIWVLAYGYGFVLFPINTVLQEIKDRFLQPVMLYKYMYLKKDYLYQNWMPIEVKIWYQNGWPNSDSLSFITYRIFKRKLKDRYLPPATPWQNLKKRLLVSINGADKFVNGSYDIKMVDQMWIHSASSRIERFHRTMAWWIFSYNTNTLNLLKRCQKINLK